MKKLANFLNDNPSYVKCGNIRIANKIGISVNTVSRFKKSRAFKELKTNYINNLQTA